MIACHTCGHPMVDHAAVEDERPPGSRVRSWSPLCSCGCTGPVQPPPPPGVTAPTVDDFEWAARQLGW